MAAEHCPPTGADVLVQRLSVHGVRHVFGYPGGQLTPIYDALYQEPSIRHILARHEQAAAFMADGYARATGQPGVCLAVCGPGVFNAATALATAFTDSVPLLLISGQVPRDGLKLRSGYYHENEQLSACASMTKWRSRVEDVQLLPQEIDRAWNALTEGRPGPVLIEVPLDLLRSPASWPAETPPAPPAPQAALDVRDLSALLARWHRPLILAGGGVISAGAESALATIANLLGAPILTTLMGKCAVPGDHPLAAGLLWHRATQDVANMEEFFSPLFQQADGVLAVGCRFTQASTGGWKLRLPELAQIDIDPAELGRHYPVALGLCADARRALEELTLAVPSQPRAAWARLPVPRPPWRLPGLDLLGPMRRVLPRDTIIAADITRLSYILLAEFPMYAPRSFLHPAGFVPMGYGIPAALGAKTAFPERTVVAVVGDGCFQMCGMELATAVQEKLPILIVLINDRCLTLIKATQAQRYEGRFIGVDLVNPDFGTFAQAFGVRYWRVTGDAEFETALREGVALQAPVLIEVRL